MSVPTGDQFWSAAAALLDRPGVTRSTMMGYPCLRLNGDFFASWDPHATSIVVKLDRPTTTALIDQGVGAVFAPSGRAFREWVSIPATSHDAWPDHLEAAFDMAVARAHRQNSARGR